MGGLGILIGQKRIKGRKTAFMCVYRDFSLEGWSSERAMPRPVCVASPGEHLTFRWEEHVPMCRGGQGGAGVRQQMASGIGRLSGHDLGHGAALCMRQLPQKDRVLVTLTLTEHRRDRSENQPVFGNSAGQQPWFPWCKKAEDVHTFQG